MDKLVSVVLPAFNEQDAISPAVERISSVLDGAGIPFELIFVNDGSRDGTWQAICREAQKNDRVRAPPSPETLARSPPFSPGSPRLPAIAASPWTATFSIRRSIFRKWSGCGRAAPRWWRR